MDVIYRKLNKEELDKAALVLTETLFKDPLFQVVFHKKTELNAFMKLLAKYCNTFGQIHHIEGFHGVALWIPPGTSLTSVGNIVKALKAGLLKDLYGFISVLSNESRKNLKTLSSFVKEHKRLPEKQFYYLLAIGVKEEMRGKGLGKALMQYALSEFEEDSIYYLENSNTEKNTRFYENFMFQVFSEGEFNGVKVYFMVRSEG